MHDAGSLKAKFARLGKHEYMFMLGDHPLGRVKRFGSLPSCQVWKAHNGSAWLTSRDTMARAGEDLAITIHTCLYGPVCHEMHLYYASQGEAGYCDHESCLEMTHEICVACYVEAMQESERQ